MFTVGDMCLAVVVTFFVVIILNDFLLPYIMTKILKRRNRKDD